MSIFPNLTGERYASLTTFRKDGEPVPTAVWFAELEGKLYVITGADAGKVKRLRNNPEVTLAPCNYKGEVKGEALPGTARILPMSDTRAQAGNRALNRKYTWQKFLLTFFSRIQPGKRRDQTVILEIDPA